MSTICGHDRDVVGLGIKILALSDNATAYADQIERDHNASGRIKSVIRDIIDPAKLAEMLAARGRELGLSIAIYDNHRRFRMSGAPVVYALLIVANGFSIMDRDRWGWDFDMPQTRTILLQWLQLPDGAREEAERVLHGNHADPDELINTIPMHERIAPRRFDPDPDRGRE